MLLAPSLPKSGGDDDDDASGGGGAGDARAGEMEGAGLMPTFAETYPPGEQLVSTIADAQDELRNRRGTAKQGAARLGRRGKWEVRQNDWL